MQAIKNTANVVATAKSNKKATAAAQQTSANTATTAAVQTAAQQTSANTATTTAVQTAAAQQTSFNIQTASYSAIVAHSKNYSANAFNAQQKIDTYAVLCSMYTNANAVLAQANNAKNSNYKQCMLMQNTQVSAASNKQIIAMHIVQAMLASTNNVVNASFYTNCLAVFKTHCVAQNMLLNKQKQCLNVALAKRYISFCLQRLLNNMHV